MDRVQGLMNDPTEIDRLESFGAKFARMQDPIVDKLIRSAPRANGEVTGVAIDNLDKMERVRLVQSVSG